ncbi:acetyltransferase [Vibrio cholerae]|nr:acetyltransferase [Vibrio cholerae]
MVTIVVLEFSGMRCQPLRRALCAFLENFHSSALIIQT